MKSGKPIFMLRGFAKGDMRAFHETAIHSPQRIGKAVFTVKDIFTFLFPVAFFDDQVYAYLHAFPRLFDNR
ncbi:MAG: hypothetical protein ACYC5X_12455 [Syntrophales bacterium]